MLWAGQAPGNEGDYVGEWGDGVGRRMTACPPPHYLEA